MNTMHGTTLGFNPPGTTIADSAIAGVDTMERPSTQHYDADQQTTIGGASLMMPSSGDMQDSTTKDAPAPVTASSHIVRRGESSMMDFAPTPIMQRIRDMLAGKPGGHHAARSA